MSIIDHLFIGVLPPPIYKAITNNFNQFSLHEFNQDHNRYLTRLPTKIPNIMAIYQNKAK